MGLLDVLTRVQRLSTGVKQIQIEDDNTSPTIVIDNQLSSVSENPVQNKVITGAINTINGSINTINNNMASMEAEIQTKQPYSMLIRRIWIGNDLIPSSSVGQDGDIYIYRPQE